MPSSLVTTDRISAGRTIIGLTIAAGPTEVAGGDRLGTRVRGR
jgi:hypothetical protein